MDDNSPQTPATESEVDDAELDAEGNDKQGRRQALDELAAQAQELDMGY